jgi:hypothetical protein
MRSEESNIDIMVDTATPSVLVEFDKENVKKDLGGALKLMMYDNDDKLENNDESKCPVTKCTLKQAGCKLDYDGTYVTMDDVSPFNVVANSNDADGYVDKICIICSNYDITNGLSDLSSGMSVSRDNITISQSKPGEWAIFLIIAIVIVAILAAIGGKKVHD